MHVKPGGFLYNPHRYPYNGTFLHSRANNTDNCRHRVNHLTCHSLCCFKQTLQRLLPAQQLYTRQASWLSRQWQRMLHLVCLSPNMRARHLLSWNAAPSYLARMLGWRNNILPTCMLQIFRLLHGWKALVTQAL